MTAFIDEHREVYGSSRSAGFCRSPHPPIMSVSLSDEIQEGYRIVLGAIGI
jgi:hypothetical protein